jgi:hypothetical protein
MTQLVFPEFCQFLLLSRVVALSLQPFCGAVAKVVESLLGVCFPPPLTYTEYSEVTNNMFDDYRLSFSPGVHPFSGISPGGLFLSGLPSNNRPLDLLLPGDPSS